jgi:hypothetical protein
MRGHLQQRGRDSWRLKDLRRPVERRSPIQHVGALVVALGEAIDEVIELCAAAGVDLPALRDATGFEHIALRDAAVEALLADEEQRTVTPFKILVDEFLEGSVKSFVILDRDYRSETTCRSIVAEFDSIGIGCHIWSRKEIESYLLIPSALARVSGLGQADAASILGDVVESLRGKVFARSLAAAEEERVGPTTHRVKIIEDFEPKFAEAWADPALRLGLVPPKEVMSQFNLEAVTRGGRPVSAAKLAKAARLGEIDAEVASVFDRIQALLNRR